MNTDDKCEKFNSTAEDGTLFSVNMNFKEDRILFSAQINKEDPQAASQYSSSYTIGNLIDIDERFRAFLSVEKLFVDAKKAASAKEIKVHQETDRLYLSFAFFGGAIEIPLFENSSNSSKDLEIKLLRYEKENEILLTMLEEKKKKIESLEGMLEKANLSKGEPSKKLSEIIDNAIDDTARDEVCPSKQENKRFSPSNLKLRKTIDEHTDYIWSICLIDNQWLASSPDDTTVKIFNLINYQCEATLTGHAEGVLHVSKLENGNLVTSSNKEIKIWEIADQGYKCIHTLLGHKDWINKTIQLSDKSICSCSNDKTIKFWESSSPYNCIKTVEEHCGSVKSIIELKDKKHIVSGGKDKTLIFWDYLSNRWLSKVSEVECFYSGSMMETCDGKLIVGGEKEMFVVDTKNYKLERKIAASGVGYFFSLVELCDQTILSGCYFEGRCSFVNMDISKGEVISAKQGVHSGNITGLVKFDGTTLISCSHDEAIKIWKY